MPDGRLATLAPAGVDAARLVLPVDVSAIRLCRPGPADAEEFVTAARRSSDLMAEWGSPATTVEAYTSWSQPPELARTERFLVRSAAADGALVGFVSVQQISAGTLRNGVLGYGAFVPHAGRGLMSAGVAAAVRHCFTALPHGLGLHRVEANVQPGNERSAALVRRLGFRHEGFSPRLLWLAGGWRDHDRYALTVEDWLPPDAPPDAPATAPATAPPDAPAPRSRRRGLPVLHQRGRVPLRRGHRP